MAQITHCGQPRRTKSYWLFPKSEEDKQKYRYQILLTTDDNCPDCGQFVMEWMPVFANWRRGGQKRIGTKHHDEWLARTHPVTGDLSDVDTSQWASKKAGVHRVMSSLREFPYTQYEARV